MEQQTLFQKLLNEENYKNEIKTEGINNSLNLKIILIFSTLLITTFFFVFQIDNNYFNQSNSKDFIWQEPDLVAENSFPIFKDDNQLIKEQNDAASKVSKVYLLNSNVEEETKKIISQASENIINYSTENNSLFEISAEQQNKLTALSASAKKKLSENISKYLNNFLSEIYKFGFIDKSISTINNDNIIVRYDQNNEYILKTDNLTDRSTFIEKSEKYFKARLNDLGYDIVMSLINKLDKPNLKESKKLTNQLIELTRNSVPKTIGYVPEGTIIVKKGDVVDNEIMRKIVSYQKTKWIQNESSYSIIYLLGNFGHVLILYSILLLYLFILRKEIFYDNKKMAIISGILILSAFLSWLSIELNFGYPFEYLIFIPALSMLVAVVFDSRTAFYVTLTMSLILAGIRGSDYNVGISMIFAGTLAAYTVKDIQSRTQMFQSMFYIFLGLLISILAFSAEKSIDWHLTYQKIAIGLINAALSPLISFGFIIILEKVSSITTDLKIKEFDNLDHPLLVKLSEIAPGTYQHSLGVANLAERCARRVNGNPLLVKVGAYFHDIGKMVKPEYFTENQINMENKHDMLPPKKSAQIIKAHVTDGIEMAKQYKLPGRLIDFIATHHGTTQIKHFYAKALEESDGNINEEDFRYPGPKPRTLDEAIVMICDSAEAIARVVAKSEDEVIKILEEHMKERLLDGQFDECEITMEEIQIVKDTIYKNLKGVSHQRVAYKEIPKDKNNK